MNPPRYSPDPDIMLIGGAVVLLVGLALLIYLVANKRSTKPALAIIPLAILMIGFPHIKSFEGLGLKIETLVDDVQSKSGQVESNPANEAALAELQAALCNLESKVTTNTATASVAETIARGQAALGHSARAAMWAGVAVAKAPESATARTLLARIHLSEAIPDARTSVLTSDARTELSIRANALGRETNLSPTALATLAHAQLWLGLTNAAASNAQTAVKASAHPWLDPKLLKLLPSK